MLLPIVVLVLVAALIVGLIVTIVILGQKNDTRLHRGVSASRRRAVRATGLRAQATVIDVQYETLLGANDMVVQVALQGRPPYRAEVAEIIGLDLNHFALNGMTIAVFVDRNDPRVVVVDLADLERKARQKVTAEKERHDALLRGP